jgi:hypothetical protein
MAAVLVVTTFSPALAGCEGVWHDDHPEHPNPETPNPKPTTPNNQVAKEFGMSPTELALAWCTSQQHVTSTIIGATSVAQVASP